MGTVCPHFCTQNCGIMRAKVYIAQNSDSIGHLAEVIYALRCNFFTLKAGRGQHSKYLPFAFTREGIAMLSGLLRSEIAVQANISIMLAFPMTNRLSFPCLTGLTGGTFTK